MHMQDGNTDQNWATNIRLLLFPFSESYLILTVIIFIALQGIVFSQLTPTGSLFTPNPSPRPLNTGFIMQMFKKLEFLWRQEVS